jgi:hypothetical protein
VAGIAVEAVEGGQLFDVDIAETRLVPENALYCTGELFILSNKAAGEAPGAEARVGGTVEHDHFERGLVDGCDNDIDTE